MRPFLRYSARVARSSRQQRCSPRIVAGTSPNWCAFQVQSPRFQSGQPSGRPNDPDGSKDNGDVGKPDRKSQRKSSPPSGGEKDVPRSESSEEPQPGNPLAPGRTPLTPEDEAILQRMMNDMKQMEGVFGESDLKSVQSLMERWKREGADKDLQEFLRLSKEGKPSLSATVKLVRSIMSLPIQSESDPAAEEQEPIETSIASTREEIQQNIEQAMKQLETQIESNLKSGTLKETSDAASQKLAEIKKAFEEEVGKDGQDTAVLLEINEKLREVSATLGLYQERAKHGRKRRAQQPRQGQGKGQNQQEGDKKDGDRDNGFFGNFPSFQGGKGIKLDLNTIVTTAIVTWIVGSLMWPGENSKEITWQEFRSSLLEKGLVEKIVVTNSHFAKVYLRKEDVAAVLPDSPAVYRNFYYYFSIASIEAFEKRLDEAQREMNIPSTERIPVAFQEEIPWLTTLINFGPSVLFIGAILALTRRAGNAGGNSGLFGIGRSRAKQFNHESAVKVKFADVAGMDEAKLEIMEFVSFLKEPSIYQRLGAKIPRGAILSGPPGTGKTLLAKATAGESAVPFYSVSGSEFVEMFVGVGPSRVRDLFATARKNTPCIIFIDEIDAIGRARSSKSFGGGNDERESTLNQILTEMDGFNTSEQVVVMAGTNRPDILDKALLRPGRFDRHIMIDSPTMKGRAQIFAVHLKKIVTNEDTTHLRGRLAALTPGFSGADIANCVNEAALIAARSKAESVELTHFEQAIERVVGGLERKSLVLSPEEKKVVAYHEAGHAVCGWYFRYADPLLKVSIIPRGSGALGYAQYLPEGDTYLMNALQLMDRMAMALGGRVSEELHFETVTSGASDDFKKVTAMATAMVTRFGMSRKIGYLSFDENQEQLHKPFSEETAKSIDGEVRRIVEDAYKQCRDLLTEKKAEIGVVAEELLKKEVLSRDDMIRLLGARPFPEKGEFHKYFGLPPPPPPGEAAAQDPPAPDPPLVVPPTEGGPSPSPALFKRT